MIVQMCRLPVQPEHTVVQMVEYLLHTVPGPWDSGAFLANATLAKVPFEDVHRKDIVVC